MDDSSATPFKCIRRLDENAWLQAGNSLVHLRLQGLQIRCPKCRRIGVPFSKWINGPKTKPLCVFHKNGRGEAEACFLDKDEAAQVRGHVTLEQDDVKALLRAASAFVLFSGGLDSLCTLDYLASIGSVVGRRITALYVDTTVGFPEVTEYVKSTCEKMGIALEILRPQTDFFTLAKKWGIPGINSRWCCRELKIRPIMTFLEKRDGPKIVFDGIRAAESRIRAQYIPVWFHPTFNCLSVSPIFDWSDEDVRSYARRREFPTGPSFELGSSGECWCGAYKKKTDFETLYHLDPALYHRLADVEENNERGYTFIYEDGKRVPLRELEKEILESLNCT